MSQTQSSWESGTGRFLNTLFSLVAMLADAALVLLLGVMSIEVVLRVTGSGSLVIADEMSAALLVTTTFLGLSVAVRKQALFRFDGMVQRIPERYLPAYERVLLLIALGTTGVLAWYLVRFVMSTVRRGTVSSGMVDYPLWITQVVMPIGLFLLIVALLEQLMSTGQKSPAAKGNHV